MTALDIIVLLLVGGIGIRGLMRGFVAEAMSLVAWIAAIAAVKLIQLGPDLDVGGFPLLPLITDGGALLFPLTYVLGDVLAEVYGMRGARRAILLGFVISALASVTFLAVGALPPAADWPNQAAFDAVSSAAMAEAACGSNRKSSTTFRAEPSTRQRPSVPRWIRSAYWP